MGSIKLHFTFVKGEVYGFMVGKQKILSSYVPMSYMYAILNSKIDLISTLYLQCY